LFIVFIILYCIIAENSKAFTTECLNTFAKRIILLAVVGLAMILPTLPISISAGYQGVVNEYQYISLPVTFCVYFATVIAIAIVIWEIITRIKMAGAICVGLVITSIFTQIQIMNNAFSNVQYHYFCLLESQEKVFETNTIKELNIENLYATDLFTQHRTLAFHGSYWNDYADYAGVDINVINDLGEINDWRLYSDEGELTSLTNGTNLYIFTDNDIEGEYWIQINEENSILVKLLDGEKDNDKYVYSFMVEGDKAIRMK